MLSISTLLLVRYGLGCEAILTLLHIEGRQVAQFRRTRGRRIRNIVSTPKVNPKQVWDNTVIASPWLNLMRNAMNVEVWSFRHPDFLCVSNTHGTAQLALYDNTMWDKYGFAKLTGDKFSSNSFAIDSSSGSATDFESPSGPFSPKGGDSIPVLQRRGAVFMACHNAVWELASHLVADGSNPDHLGVDVLAADLTNHLLPGVILTPGAVGTLVELQRAGFTYGK